MKRIKKQTHEFVLKHDYIKLFVISYVLISVVLAVFFGLFYFMLWILLHIFMEIYKRWHLFGKFDLEDLLIVIKHCGIDLMFLFMGIGIEALSNHSFAIAGGRIARLLEIEMGFVEESRLLEIVRALPRVLGVTKAAKGTAKIAEEIIEHKEVKELKRFKMEKIDWLILMISVISILIPFIILKYEGFGTIEILKMFLETLHP